MYSTKYVVRFCYVACIGLLGCMLTLMVIHGMSRIKTKEIIALIPLCISCLDWLHSLIFTSFYNFNAYQKKSSFEDYCIKRSLASEIIIVRWVD